MKPLHSDTSFRTNTPVSQMLWTLASEEAQMHLSLGITLSYEELHHPRLYSLQNGWWLTDRYGDLRVEILCSSLAEFLKVILVATLLVDLDATILSVIFALGPFNLLHSVIDGSSECIATFGTSCACNSSRVCIHGNSY